ncbi:MAG TPA: DNA/RNA non-specific endonuclease [Campylobacterales bacterium]|nr:DNA/RNA non-specific endonuclease [Campylobacterales bacterium]
MWLFLGCDTAQIEQEDNSSTPPISTNVLGINNIVEKNSTLNSSSITEETQQIDNSIDTIIDITPSPTPIPTHTSEPTPTPIPIHTPIPTHTPEPTPTPEEPKDYKTKFINENRCNQIIDKEFLEICYDYSLKVAKSVAYTLEGDLVNELNIEERPSFYEEESIDEQYRAKSSDYTHSGYDRGHMAPDAAFDWSEESLEATYSLANIIPQVPEVNRHMWVKVEAYARDKALDLGEITVVNVVKYDNNNSHIGDDNITVSTGYYKMLFNTNESYEECFYYANDINANSEDDNLSKHKVDCKNINN